MYASSLPNFFIVGAPKSGTTSLAAWLAEHPQVYMSPVKEPHHYSFDLDYRGYRERHQYQALFEDVKEAHTAIGEASVWYLFSRAAIPVIEAEISHAKYIVLLRNPIDMAFSLHGEQLFHADENIRSFEKAWYTQTERAQGKRIPRLCNEPQLLQYRQACSLGTQMKRLYSMVSQDRVLPILLEDMKSDPRSTWLQVMAFLNVPDDGRSDFPVFNRAKYHRYPIIPKLMRCYGLIIRKLGIKPLKLGMSSRLSESNARPSLSSAMHQELIAVFREDICLLENLLNRDLSHWLT